MGAISNCCTETKESKRMRDLNAKAEANLSRRLSTARDPSGYNETKIKSKGCCAGMCGATCCAASCMPSLMCCSMPSCTNCCSMPSCSCPSLNCCGCSMPDCTSCGSCCASCNNCLPSCGMCGLPDCGNCCGGCGLPSCGKCCSLPSCTDCCSCGIPSCGKCCGTCGACCGAMACSSCCKKKNTVEMDMTTPAPPVIKKPTTIRKLPKPEVPKIKKPVLPVVQQEVRKPSLYALSNT